jgi:hypothetical protein
MLAIRTSPYIRRPPWHHPFPNLNLCATEVHQALTCACAGDPGADHLAEQCCDPPGSQWLQAAVLRRVDPAAVNMLSHEHTAPHPRRRASFSASKVGPVADGPGRARSMAWGGQ